MIGLSKIVSIRLPESLYQELLQRVEQESYRDMSELIRTIITEQSFKLYRDKTMHIELIKKLEKTLEELKRGVINE